MSLSAIEKRKLNLKETLSVKGGSDVELISEAKNKGLIQSTFFYVKNMRETVMYFTVNRNYNQLITNIFTL